MRDKSDPALGSSSIDSRVRLKNKVGVEPLESMDSSDLSLDLTLEIESLNYPAAKGAPPAAEAERLPPMGPLSIIGKEKKCHQVFDGLWTEKFAFMHLPRFSSVWRVAGGEVLECCSIWGNMSGSKGEEALEEYKKAFEEQQAQTIAAPAPSSSKKSKASRSTPKISPSSSCESGTVLTKLNTKAMSQIFHLGERMDDQASIKADMDALASQLHEEKDNVLAKKKEIKALRLKVRNQDEAGMMAASENISLREQLERREEEIFALEQYKMVKTSEAQLQRLPAPSFEEEPSVPGEIEAEKTLEPTADDPPAD
ncbi:hypothetical protein HID58_087267 [Brassica napus]|uniref:Uncharacterized protein n=1 Tax=Brassica napus TaxID=3708 RepID=A0ABQ7XSV5_BRANA|nr:hypothetical protein HID58_087267 [Brassica napus]